MPRVTLTTSGPNAIEYYEYPDGYGEAFQPEGTECVRRLACAWEDREGFKDDIVGLTLAGFDPGTGRLRRYVPDEHPWFSGMYAVTCRLAEKQGVPNQDAQGRLTFDLRTAAGAINDAGSGDSTGYAVYDVGYRRTNLFFKSDEDTTSELDRWVLRRGRDSTESLTIPGMSYVYGALNDAGLPAGTLIPANVAGSPITGDTAKQFPFGTYTWEWFVVPQVPYDKIRAGLGKINSVAFDANFGNWPAETMYLQSAEYEPAQHASSYYYYTIKYTFIYRPTGWNKVFNRTYADFFKVIDKSSGTKGIYTTYDMHELFKFV